MAINGIQKFTLDVYFNGTITKSEAVTLAAEKGINLDESKLTKNSYTSQEFNTIVGQYGVWRDDISTMWQAPKTGGDKASVVADLKAKYSVDTEYKGDKYSMNNPQLQAFKRFVDDGQVEELGKTFSRSDIINIVKEVFPNIGIKLLDEKTGKYELPKGHGSDASAVYDLFGNKIAKVIGNTPEILALEKELNEKVNQLNTNVKNTNILKTQINTLKSQIEKEITDALSDSEKIEEQAKKDAEKAVRDELDKYEDSDGAISFEQFEENVRIALGKIVPHDRLSTIYSRISNAESKFGTLKNLVTQIGNLNTKNTTLRVQIGDLNKRINIERMKDAANVEPPGTTNPNGGAGTPKRTDPIGFKLASGVQLDFFIDTDNDGLLSNEKEFLGAKNGWSEMTALDTSGDGKVDYAELAAQQNLMVVITNTDGTQEYKKVSDYFKEGDEIDLNSFEAKSTKIAGTDNILAGNFNIKVDGQTLQGYQTLDTLEYLDSKYNFSDKDNGLGRFAQGVINALEGTEVLASEFNAMIEALTQKISDAKDTLDAREISMQAGINSAYDNDIKTEADDYIYKPSEWDSDLNALERSINVDIFSSRKDTLMTRLRNSKYPSSDKLLILERIRNSVAKALRTMSLDLFSTDSDLKSLGNEHEIEAKAYATGLGVTYEIHEYDPKTGTHTKKTINVS